MDTKEIFSMDIILSYNKFSEEFIIHTDAKKTHLREVIKKMGIPLPFTHVS